MDQESSVFLNFSQTSDHNKSYTSIPEFYVGRSVFITGGTGFMGKASFNSDHSTMPMKFHTNRGICTILFTHTLTGNGG